MGLIEQIQKGNKEAFEAFFFQYKDMVFKTAYLITGNGEEAEDVVQEVFTKVYRKAHTIQEGGNIKAWLRRTTVNECINKHRKGRPASPLDGTLLKEDPDLLLRIIADEERKKVNEALRSLKEKYRVVLVLRHYQELSYEEIAKTLEIPLGTVKSRINKAINSLRKELKKRGVDHEL